MRQKPLLIVVYVSVDKGFVSHIRDLIAIILYLDFFILAIVFKNAVAHIFHSFFDAELTYANYRPF